MRSRWHRPAEIVLSAMVLVCLPVIAPVFARAQMLDLTGPHLPEPGDGKAALALAATLGREADGLDGRDEHSRAKSAWRRLARLLLESAEEAGPDASVTALTARTLCANSEALDGLIDRADPDAAWLAAIAFERLIGSMPTDQRTLDSALRDSIAPLLTPDRPPAASSGWFAADPAPPGMNSASATQIDADLSRLLADSGAHPAYSRTVSRVQRLLADASGVITPPGWISRDAGSRLERAWSECQAGLTDPATQRDSISRLERLAAWGGVFASLDDGSRDAASISARRAVNTSIITNPSLLGGGAERTRAILAVADLLAETDLSRLEAGLARPLRPVWKRVELRHLDARGRQLLDLHRVLDSPRPLTDPAVLARLDACRRSNSALRGLATLSRVLTGVRPLDSGDPRPKINPGFRNVADRLIDLARGLNRDDDTDTASALLEAMVEWAGRHGEWPGEADLRLGGPLADEIAGIAGLDVPGMISMIDRARHAWLSAWAVASSPADLGIADAWMDEWRNTLSLLTDAATLAPVIRGERPLAANAWPGFEMSGRAMRLVTRELDTEAREAWDATRDRDPEAGSASALERLAPARLVALIEREVIARGPHPDPGWAICELVAGPPIESLCFGVRARDAIARVCRYAEEDAAGEDWLTPYVRLRAAEAIAEIE